MFIGVQAMPSMCDIGVQCNLLPSPSCLPIMKKGEIVPVIEDADPFEFAEEEKSEIETTESTMHWETTALTEDEKNTPVEKQLTFVVFSTVTKWQLGTGAGFIVSGKHGASG